MKKKQKLAYFFTAILAFGCLCGCGTTAAPMEETAQESITEETETEEKAPAQKERSTKSETQMTLAEIISIDDTTATIQLLNGRGSHKMDATEKGERPQRDDSAEKSEDSEEKERPEKKERPAEDTPKERPDEKKEHTAHQSPENASAPNAPVSEPTTIDLAEFDTIDAASLQAGDLISLEIDTEGTIVAIQKAEAPAPSENENDA